MPKSFYEYWKDDQGLVHLTIMVKYHDGSQSRTTAPLTVAEARVLASGLSALTGEEETLNYGS